MNTSRFSTSDLAQMAAHGISPEQVDSQLQRFATGFPYLPLHSSATLGHGICSANEHFARDYFDTRFETLYGDELQRVKIVKFVPASGAASRMFKDLYAFLGADYDTPQTDFEKTFFADIHRFAFFDELNSLCCLRLGAPIDECLQRGAYKAVVRLLLAPKGMNYGALPKALLTFHRHGDTVRKAFEEHLAEGAAYAGSGGEVHIHFTVSKEHRAQFEEAVKEAVPQYEVQYGKTFHITFSEQLPSTDTIAADEDNQPFRDKSGQLVFRPGGHGALIHNLNGIDADIVFVKNIDNVVPEAQMHDTVLYKKVLLAMLLTTQGQIHHWLGVLRKGADGEQLQQILDYVKQQLCIVPPASFADDDALAAWLFEVLHRPLRVCGMVRNTGEPGGGPFLAADGRGIISLQILESSQIDHTDARSMEMFREGTHFNPVDMVCALKDDEGKPYHLPDFVDADTGFISEKSKDGRTLKALELPGLWNGAMSRWNTVFMEVPLTTFNPVKTVNDLLRPAHQG